ncbi:MAG: hypothetical protein E6J91_06735, partial [Deltaproteobacteria bacterium]
MFDQTVDAFVGDQPAVEDSVRSAKLALEVLLERVSLIAVERRHLIALGSMQADREVDELLGLPAELVARLRERRTHDDRDHSRKRLGDGCDPATTGLRQEHVVEQNLPGKEPV